MFGQTNIVARLMAYPKNLTAKIRNIKTFMFRLSICRDNYKKRLKNVSNSGGLLNKI